MAGPFDFLSSMFSEPAPQASPSPATGTSLFEPQGGSDVGLNPFALIGRAMGVPTTGERMGGMQAAAMQELTGAVKRGATPQQAITQVFSDPNTMAHRIFSSGDPKALDFLKTFIETVQPPAPTVVGPGSGTVDRMGRPGMSQPTEANQNFDYQLRGANPEQRLQVGMARQAPPVVTQAAPGYGAPVINQPGMPPVTPSPAVPSIGNQEFTAQTAGLSPERRAEIGAQKLAGPPTVTQAAPGYGPPTLNRPGVAPQTPSPAVPPEKLQILQTALASSGLDEATQKHIWGLVATPQVQTVGNTAQTTTLGPGGTPSQTINHTTPEAATFDQFVKRAGLTGDRVQRLAELNMTPADQRPPQVMQRLYEMGYRGQQLAYLANLQYEKLTNIHGDHIGFTIRDPSQPGAAPVLVDIGGNVHQPGARPGVAPAPAVTRDPNSPVEPSAPYLQPGLPGSPSGPAAGPQPAPVPAPAPAQPPQQQGATPGLRLGGSAVTPGQFTDFANRPPREQDDTFKAVLPTGLSKGAALKISNVVQGLYPNAQTAVSEQNEEGRSQLMMIRNLAFRMQENPRLKAIADSITGIIPETGILSGSTPRSIKQFGDLRSMAEREINLHQNILRDLGSSREAKKESEKALVDLVELEHRLPERRTLQALDAMYKGPNAPNILTEGKGVVQQISGARNQAQGQMGQETAPQLSMADQRLINSIQTMNPKTVAKNWSVYRTKEGPVRDALLDRLRALDTTRK